MKPSPHQDAADLVARLDLTDARKCPFDGDNNLLPSDPCPICGDTGEFNSDPAPSKCISFSQQTVLDEAKAFIEQQAKALSEAERKIEHLEWAIENRRITDSDNDEQYEAMEARLAEANGALIHLRDWLILAGDLTCRETPLGIIAAALANQGPE